MGLGSDIVNLQLSDPHLDCQINDIHGFWCALYGIFVKTIENVLFCYPHPFLPPLSSSAISYECIRTITSIYPNSALIEKAAKTIGRFVTASNNNWKYLGINSLAALVQINPKYAADHQLVVIDCLDDPDDTLKRKVWGGRGRGMGWAGQGHGRVVLTASHDIHL